jgi:rare lipoprotein A
MAVVPALLMAALVGCGREQARAPAAAPPPQPQRAAPAPAGPAQHGLASYYGREFAGRKTAAGEPHRPGALTAASRSLPLGTVAKVTNTETGKSVSVRINDRGPYAKNRILDVSPKAAEQLDMKNDGVARVTVQPMRKPSAAPARRTGAEPMPRP